MEYTIIENGDYYNNLDKFFTILSGKTKIEKKHLEEETKKILNKVNTFLVFDCFVEDTFFSSWSGYQQEERLMLKEKDYSKTISFFVSDFKQLENFLLALKEKEIPYFKVFSTLKNQQNPIHFNCPDCFADLEWDNKENKVKFIKHNI